MFDFDVLSKQSSLIKLHVICEDGWRFKSPRAGSKRLRLRELSLSSLEIDRSWTLYRGTLLESMDLNVLQALRVDTYWLIAAIFDQLSGVTPNLESLSIDAKHRMHKIHTWPLTMVEKEYTSISRFLSTNKLCEVTIRNFTHEIPWLNLLRTSGSTLIQLTIHIDYDYWSRIVSQRDVDLGGIGPFQFKRRLGVRTEELRRLGTVCPRIERLGFDIQGLSVAAVVRSHILYLDLLVEI